MRISDWSSDVCSSDLFCDGSGDEVWCTRGQAKVHGRFGLRVDTGMEVDQVVVDRRRDGAGLRICSRCAVMCRGPDRNAAPMLPQGCNIVEDRKSVVEGKSVAVRVDHGGRRFIKKKISIEIKEKILSEKI